MNKLLYSVTNRTTFHAPALNVTRAKRLDTQPDTDILRRILKLDDTSTDYYVGGLLNAMQITPGVAEMFDGITTYNWISIPAEKPSVTNAVIIPDKDGPPFFHRKIHALNELDIRIAYKAPSTVTVDNIEVESWYFSAENKLLVAFPAVFGIRCGFKLNTSWGLGSEITLRVLPTNYPYADAVLQAAKWEGLNPLLLRLGLLPKFHASGAAYMRLAYIGLALGLSNTNFTDYE
jgi:hypothetical protein